MRFSVLIISIFVFKAAIAQDPDVGEMNSYDSLILRHEKTEELYAQTLAREYSKTDTLLTKDSIVITIFSKKHLPLQRIVNFLDSSGCINYIKHKYYNPTGQIAYIKKFRQTCPVQLNLPEEERKFHPLLYERFDYDNAKQLILHVYNKTSSVTYRETYYVDENGKRQVKRKRIDETEFWKNE